MMDTAMIMISNNGRVRRLGGNDVDVINFINTVILEDNGTDNDKNYIIMILRQYMDDPEVRRTVETQTSKGLVPPLVFNENTKSLSLEGAFKYLACNTSDCNTDVFTPPQLVSRIMSILVLRKYNRMYGIH